MTSLLDNMQAVKQSTEADRVPGSCSCECNMEPDGSPVSHKSVWFLQVGRSTESPIDFVVTDTISGGQNDDAQITQSTISRFACRIVCDRNEPYTARIFAAGFDSSRNIFLGVSCRIDSGFRKPTHCCDGVDCREVA